ncbi:LOW QUALITY PROTEIN: dynein regulatory complex protein 10 [Cottoperca gobio]|uniref:Dynein regulatory complex protein 10 n=1 Tax=Cottoperca gobio TaxID=56716 RepID=A0A6J2QD12_COTGO|nr:LOW QUALITY PROTEIN: dynein regulatory complex protein 10 [Cottoperca gobio]
MRSTHIRDTEAIYGIHTEQWYLSNRGKKCQQYFLFVANVRVDSDSMSAKGSTVLSLSEDALKNHLLSQKKLLSLEAQCISNILENCISRVEIVASLPAVLRLNRVSGVVDKQLSRALQEHQLLAKDWRRLEGLKQDSDGEQEGEVVKAKAQLEQDIKNSVRGLFRLARAHPDARCGLRADLGKEVAIGDSEYKLITGLEKFLSHAVEKLLTSLDEELHVKLVLQNQVSSSPANLAELIVSQQEVATSLKQIDAQISEKNDEIKHFQDSLKGDNSQKADTSLLAEKQCQSHMKTSKHSSKQQELDRLNSQLNKLFLESRQAERVIQVENEKVETAIENLLQTFDDDIEKNQADLELEGMGYEREEEELKTLEKPFSVLEVKYNMILEKRRLAEEKRREEMRELQLKTKAAIFAQAWWRGYSTRKALKNKGKSKKAKKGKGKKTK